MAGIQSLRRALAILDLFSEDRSVLRLADIADHLGVAPITAYRYVRAFVDNGLLGMRDGEVYLTAGVMRLAYLFSSRNQALRAAREPLAVAQQLTGESLALCELQGSSVICTFRIESQQSLRTSFALGQAMPIFAGAFARALAAFLPKALMEAILAHTRWHRYTEHTLVDRAAFLERLDVIRRNGYDTSMEELDRGVFAAAVPLLSPSDGVVGSIGLSMPSTRYEPDRLPTYLEPLWTAKRAIEAQLAHMPSEAGTSPAPLPPA